MKIGILTWLYNGNYGSILQAYALQKYLSLSGYEVEDINYRPTMKTKLINLIQNKNSLALFIEKYEFYKARKACKNQMELSEKNNRFALFRNKYMSLSKEYNTPKSISEINGMYDVYICGSDQIWSPALMNPVYYFDFLKEEYKTIAYAPSFGVSVIPQNKRNRIRDYLNSFEYISVREQQGSEIVSELTGKKAITVLDPTLLLTVKDWDDIAAERIVHDEYILCYFLTYNKMYFEAITKMADRLGKKIIVIPTMKETYEIPYQKVINAGPREWISLVKHASIVCTDSFHGCVFSVLYQKDFFVFKRFSDAKKKSQNSRIYHFLNMLGIENQIVNDVKNFDRSRIGINNYNQVYEKLEYEKKKSMKWLLSAIEDSNRIT